MGAPDRFSDLSDAQQRALRRAVNGIPVDDPRAVGVERRTADVLEQLGLVVQRKTQKQKLMWRLTDAGRGLMVAHEPRLLHMRSQRGYTSDPAEAMHDEPEAVDDVALAGARRAAHYTEQERFEQLLADRERLPLAERLELARADAERRGVNIDRQLHVIAQRVKAIETLVYRPADRIAT